MLTPEQLTLIWARLNLVTLHKFNRRDQLIRHKLLDVKDEWSVLINTILDIAIEANDFGLNSSEHSEVVFYLFLSFITNPFFLLELPWLVLVELGVLPSILCMLSIFRHLFYLGYLRSANTYRFLIVNGWPNGYGICSLGELNTY